MRIGLVIVVVAAVGLVSAGSGAAAPRDNILNAAKCLRGGWQGLQTTSGRSFRGPLDCVVYALLGRSFGTVVVPPPPQPETPPPAESE